MLDNQLSGLDDALRRINDMKERVHTFKTVDVADGLSAWQLEDLRRDRPFVKASPAKGRASTTVRQHSLHELKKSLRYQRKMTRRIRTGTRKAAMWWTRFQARFSTRAILRAQLLTALHQRMVESMHSKLQW